MDNLTRDLTAAFDALPLIDPHSHIDSLAPVSKTLDDILGYHYYTELAHSAGMSQAPLSKDVSPRERVRAILGHMDRFDNTAQYGWFVDIAKTFLGFGGSKVTAKDADSLYDAAEKAFAQKDWEKQVRTKTKLEKIFLTNEFDDPLEGFDTNVYVPCLRTDALVFQLDKPEVRARLAKATGIEVGDAASLRMALARLFLHFTRKGAKACAISLPPRFTPVKFDDEHVYEQMKFCGYQDLAPGIFWMLAEFCRDFKLPFDLMIGVNRRVYEGGVYQGQDLFDQRTSLIQYKALFNAFPTVTFPISVLTSGQNQELCSYAWIFPNVVTSGHWWYSNIPSIIRKDLTERLQAVPKTKQVGYYSDAYKLEFVAPKCGMYRRILAGVLADEFVRPGMMTETDAVALGKRLLLDNVKEIFKV
jgi:glucuronate isomerase